jgi:hypothetical protein
MIIIMKHTSRYVIMVMLGVLLLLPALACGIGEKPDLDATVQAALAATQGVQATETGFAVSLETAVAATVQAQASTEEIPQAKTGEVIASGAVEIFVPPETQGEQPPITVQLSRQPYDLILSESSLKGNSPGPSEYVWGTTHLGFSAWSERRRARLSYQYYKGSRFT